MLRFFLISIFICTSFSVSARMYQWADPDSGTTQLSGKPPVWYRSSETGPRVFVFDKGRIIDDTEIEVSSTERNRLRQQAFLKAEEEREAAREKLLQAKRLKATVDQRQSLDQGPGAEDTDNIGELAEAEEESTDRVLPDTGDLTADDMRDLISEWERQRTETAKELIKPSPPDAP